MHILKVMSRIILPAVLVIIFTVIGFLVGRFGNSLNLNPPQTQNPVERPVNQGTETPVGPTTKSLEASANLLFKTQSATFQGKITGVSNRTLTVESDTGQTGQFDVSPKISIYKFTPNSSTASASADIKTIETDKQVLISLDLVGGKYQAVSISYFRTP